MTNDKLREALAFAEGWLAGCLIPPTSQQDAEAIPHLRTLIATAKAALAAPVEAEPVGLGILGIDAMTAEQLEAYDYAGNEFMAAAEKLLDEAETGEPLAGVAQARWQAIRERIHKLAHPAEQGKDAEDAARENNHE